MNLTSALQTVKVALIWVAVAVAAFLLWLLRDALLIAFGAVLAAILLRVLAGIFARWMRLSDGAALAIATVFVFAICIIVVWLFGSQVAREFGEVLSRVEAAERQIYFVTIPPALMLIGIVAVDLIFGPVGLIFAAPITVAVFVAVKIFYVRDILKQQTDIPGED